jgi:hypothetical protein
MLNPSTADADIDDPTIRRCMGFARREGYGGVAIANLYAFRATRPVELFRADDPHGPGNAKTLRDLAAAHKIIVCAWGRLPTLAARAHAQRVAAKLARHGAQLYCFGRTAEGAPRHPLYLPLTAPLEAF